MIAFHAIFNRNKSMFKEAQRIVLFPVLGMRIFEI